nr:hypothetical protein [Candidatus Sigynarchaeota archaeon]
FVGINASASGEFWTIPFTSRSPSVYINAKTAAHGWIEIGLEDAVIKGTIEGFTTRDCDLLQYDLLWKKVTWNGNADLSDFSDAHLLLHVRMYQATIYAFKFE